MQTNQTLNAAASRVPSRLTARPLATRGFNLFRRIDGPELICAVPDNRAVPGFITNEGWTFVERVEAGEELPRGFDAHASDSVIAWNGFYLFESWLGG
jgi:hypothetical protein